MAKRENGGEVLDIQDDTKPKFKIAERIHSRNGNVVQATVGTTWGYFSLTGQEIKPTLGKMVAVVPTQNDMQRMYETKELSHLVEITYRPEGYKAPWE